MEIKITELQRKSIVLIDGRKVRVIDLETTKPGKGGAFIKLKGKEVKTGIAVEKTIDTSRSITQLYIEKKTVNFLYEIPGAIVFQGENHEEITLITSSIEKSIRDYIPYCDTPLELEMDENGEVLEINLPEKIKLMVKDTPPAMKGSSVKQTSKRALMENNVIVTVPQHIDNNDYIWVQPDKNTFIKKA